MFDSATPEAQTHHDALVAFLREQDELHSAVKSLALDYDIYQPVVITRPERVQIGARARIDSFVKIEGGESVVIGRFVHIASFAHLNIGGGALLIDDFAAVASGGKIISGSNQIDALSMSACAPHDLQRVKKSRTIIHKYAVVLSNAVVLPGVTLHEGAVLAAGGVATRDIPPWEIWGGVPAKFMARRKVVVP